MKPIIWLAAAAAALVWGQEKASPDAAIKNVELTVYLLSGTQAAASDDVPQDLASTVKQLHSVFSYKSYKLSDSLVLRGRPGDTAGTSGILPESGLHYNFGYRRVQVSGGKPYMVHIDFLHIALSSPISRDGKVINNNELASITTSLDLAEGQKTVVGKSSFNNAGDALILVIVPKVIE